MTSQLQACQPSATHAEVVEHARSSSQLVLVITKDGAQARLKASKFRMQDVGREGRRSLSRPPAVGSISNICIVKR